MAVAGRFCALGILVLQLQSTLSSPTCICNGNNNRINPRPTLALLPIGNNQAQSINQQPNIEQAIANQLRLKEINGLSSALARQQPNGPLQPLAPQPSNAAPIPLTGNHVAHTRPTITLLDPATTAAFKAFLSSRASSSVDQQVSVPGQTRLPLSSLPTSFINKCQNTPTNQHQSLSNIQPNAAPTQKSITPLQGHVSMESLLNLLSNVQNLQPSPVANHNKVPAILNNAVLNQPQSLIGQQNVAPPLNPVPNPLVSQSYVSAPQSEMQPLIQSQSTMPSIPYPQSQISNQQHTLAPPTQSAESSIQSANTNLQKLLPLLFDLVKENQCGCHSCTCPHNNKFNIDSNNYATQQPHVNSDYANQITYGYTEKSDTGETDNDVFESLGSLRDRLKLWKAKNDSESDTDASEQRSDSGSKDE